MKLKIVGDGTYLDTTVVDAETEEVIEGVIAINYSIEANETPILTITVAGVKWEQRK